MKPEDLDRVILRVKQIAQIALEGDKNEAAELNRQLMRELQRIGFADRLNRSNKPKSN